MVVKIVGQDSSAIKETTCHSCAARLQYTKSDTRRIEHSWDYTGGKEISDGFNCPNCGKEVLVN